MKRSYRSKRIYLTTDNSRYCIVRLYGSKEEMQKGYEAFRPDDDNHDKVLGAHCGYEKIRINNDRSETLSKETAQVFLNVAYCGAGIVSHELLHACLWAWRFCAGKEQYPIVINNMDDEEDLLHNHTYAVKQFYTWFYKVVQPQ